VALLVLAGVASMVGIGELLMIRLEDRTRDALDQEVLELRELLSERPATSREARRTFDVFLDRNVPSEDEALLFFADGRPYRSELSRFPLDRLPRDVMAALARQSTSPPPEGRTVEGGFESPLGHGYYRAVPAGRSGVFVVAILPAEDLREIAELQSTGYVVLFVIVALASLLAWMATQRAFRPLRALSEAAKGISDSDLSRRLPVRGGTEEVEMARAFNGMLDRLEDVVRTQREFLRHASHELRVPLTVGIGQLDVLAHAPDQTDRAIGIVIEELTRGSRIVDELRLLTESELPDFVRPKPLELGSLSDRLIAKAVTLAPRRWVLESRGEGEFAADGDRLTQAVMNLAHNAANHTPDGGTIGIGSAADGDEIRLWVRDQGPGVAEAERERIFEPFQRGTGAHRRYRGAGLGLAIVRAVAEAHGGRVELSGAEGARFAIAIPRRAPGSAEGWR
jgi:two-component system OmpR family sensor kinase